tara:strand:- start:7493 stop:8041 length:549 start_codon:yes stop_codon:yes gene_type:complete
MEVIFNEMDDDAIRMYQEELSDEDDELSTELKREFINKQKKIYKALMIKGVDGIKLNGLGKDILEYLLDKFWASSAYGQAYKKESRRGLLRDINEFSGYEYVSTDEWARESQLGKALENLITLGIIDLVDEEEAIIRNRKIREQNKNKTKGISLKKELNYNVEFNELRIRLRSANHCLRVID